MAQDVPSLGQVSPVPGGWRTKLSSCQVSLTLGVGAGWDVPTLGQTLLLGANWVALRARPSRIGVSSW